MGCVAPRPALTPPAVFYPLVTFGNDILWHLFAWSCAASSVVLLLWVVFESLCAVVEVVGGGKRGTVVDAWWENMHGLFCDNGSGAGDLYACFTLTMTFALAFLFEWWIAERATGFVLASLYPLENDELPQFTPHQLIANITLAAIGLALWLLFRAFWLLVPKGLCAAPARGRRIHADAEPGIYADSKHGEPPAGLLQAPLLPPQQRAFTPRLEQHRL